MLLSPLSNATAGWTDHQHLDKRYASNAPAEVVCENKQPSSEDRVANHAAPNTSPSPEPMDTQRLVVDPSLANALDKLDAWAKEGRPKEDRENAKKEIKVFLENPGATKIILRFSNLSSLPDIFGEQRFKDRLEELDLRYNQLTKLPDGIWQLQKLNNLNLSGNQLTQLPDGIWQLQKLNNLKLSGNKLTQLPDGIWQLQNLNNLNLSHNQLTKLPDGIWQLQNLNNLNLSGNKLTQLPDEIWKLQKLNNLNLSRNQLTQLPDGIWKLDELNQLDLSGNKLTELPDEIWKLHELNQLDLGGNQLTSLPNEIWMLKKLKHLDLAYINLKSLSEKIKQLQNLETLSLCNNQLTSLPDEIWLLEKLKYLDITNINLKSLSEKIKQLQNLETLSLCNNQLTSLPEEINQLKRLNTLYLEGNKELKSLPNNKLTDLLTHCTVFVGRTGLPHNINGELYFWKPLRLSIKCVYFTSTCHVCAELSVSCSAQAWHCHLTAISGIHSVFPNIQRQIFLPYDKTGLSPPQRTHRHLQQYLTALEELLYVVGQLYRNHLKNRKFVKEPPWIWVRPNVTVNPTYLFKTS